jgi:hypothetical protein
MDVLAVSSYPYLAEEVRTADDIHETYYLQLADHFSGEVLLIDTAYTSAPVSNERVVGTEADQDLYVQRLLADADTGGFRGVIWRAAFDPQYASSGAIAVFKNIGLRLGDGTNKRAWNTWEAWSLQPYEP